MDKLITLMKKHDLRITKPRRIVFDLLKHSSTPLGLGEIAKRCEGVDRSSIYRVIDTYTEIGVVKVVNIGWKKLYELTDLFHPHHHHFRCDVCGKMMPIADDDLEEAVEAISKRYDFKPSAHHFEIEGVCRNCQLADLAGANT